jgi:hypothetical protein
MAREEARGLHLPVEEGEVRVRTEAIFPATVCPRRGGPAALDVAVSRSRPLASMVSQVLLWAHAHGGEQSLLMAAATAITISMPICILAQRTFDPGIALTGIDG